jgi:hypothetical protein
MVSTENATCQRPRWNDTVAERIRAVPRSTCRASLRVDSWVRTTPIRGSFTCRRSAAVRPNAPVLNRHDKRARFVLNRGNRIVGPLRLPCLELCQLVSAVARFASPEA